MLANNDNVYLLQPLALKDDSLIPAPFVQRRDLTPARGIAVVDFYIANTRLNELLRLFAKSYLPIITSCGVNRMTLWTSVLAENDFPRLPVFQDKNLLVTIAFYNSESDYRHAMKKITLKTGDELRLQLQDVITTQHTMILYPTEAAIRQALRP